MLGLDAAGIEAALGVALSQSAGSLQFLANGAWTKRFQIGWASMGGLCAATLAAEGFRGPAAALEGQFGFLQAYSPNPVPERAVQGLGDEFELMRTGVKPYPSCRYGHAGIDAALALRAAHTLRAEEIESVTYALPPAGMRLVGEPADRKADPRSVVDAQHSAPFAIACALATGAMEWDSYRLLGDPAIRALLAKVHCVPDAAMAALGPMAGHLTITARGGTFAHTVAAPVGEPENFPSLEDLRGKFDALVTPVLGPDRTARLANAVLAIDTLNDIARLTRLGTPVLSARLAG